MSDLRTYKWPMKTFWWVKKPSYFLFVMRELSSIFVAWWVVFLLILVAAVGRGEGAYEDFLDFAENPAVIVLNVIAFAFVVLHTVTWFSLTPKAMDARLARPSRACPDGGRVAVRRPRGRLRVHLLAGDRMIKRRVEPFVWLAFSGGGVMAAIFLPMLAFLFGLAYPLGWLDPPDYDHLHAVVRNPLTILFLLGLFVMLLIHSAHRFRFTLYDGLQIKSRKATAVLCYGGAAVIALVAVGVLL